MSDMAEDKKTKPPEPEYPDTPSGKALAKVGALAGEDADDPEAAAAHGEKYAAEKKKNRWG